MSESFALRIRLLRKERKITQKQAAKDLGVSQALLSHYEKNIRECGLQFVVRIADYYNVSTDYLLGRTADRSGAQLTVDDIPEPNAAGKENVFKGSVLPTLNKKLIANSLNIIFDFLQAADNKGLTIEVSAFLMLAIYRAFYILYSSNEKNPPGMFGSSPGLTRALADAQMQVCEAVAQSLAKGYSVNGNAGVSNTEVFAMSPEMLSKKYPLFASSLLNLVQSVEQRMNLNNKNKK